MTVSELIAQLQKLPPDLKVEAEGCDCVNDVRAAGVYVLNPGSSREDGKPRCILVCEPDFYGILGPSMKERQRQRYLQSQKRQDQPAGQ